MATLSFGDPMANDRLNINNDSSSGISERNSFGVNYGKFNYGRFNYGKYRSILISVALFILLDASVMVLNFYVSFEIADDAVGVNLAGRQRMLSQRMAKTLYALNSEMPNSSEYIATAKELKNAENLFDETLTTFSQGGIALSAGNNMVALQKVKSVAGQQFLLKATEIWLPYKLTVDNLLNNITQGKDTTLDLREALLQAKAHNLELLRLMNELTLNLEQVAASKASRLRIIQTVGITLAIINFLFIMLHFLRQLRDSDFILEKARKETTEILQTVSDGLFLVDENLRIGEQYSARLVDVLGTENIAGQSFQLLLEGMIAEKDAEVSRGFIELLFDKKIKEKLIGDLNPLSLVEVNLAQASGGFLAKYLQFSFARAYQNKTISHVLVTVSDVTEKVRLEKALVESRSRNEAQIEMLASLLHTHPTMLQEFIHNSYACYKRINDVLRKPAKTVQLVREKTTEIFREIHNFKGEAASLKLEYFENQAHSFEDTLVKLRSKRELNGNDYLVLTVQLEALIGYTQQVEQIAQKLALFGTAPSWTSPAPVGKDEKNVVDGRLQDGWSQLPDFVQNVAKRNGKLVKLVTSGLSEIELVHEYNQHVREICIQLLRNAVVHGIEMPGERELSEKPTEGRIDLRMAKISDDEMEITVMDDGAGLDYSAIRDKAIAAGRWSEDEIESWGNKHLLALIFQQGFSTAKDITKDAGRGVGMEVVMNRVLEHRGKITVSSRRGRHCRFVITLPIISAVQEVAA